MHNRTLFHKAAEATRRGLKGARAFPQFCVRVGKSAIVRDKERRLFCMRTRNESPLPPPPNTVFCILERQGSLAFTIEDNSSHVCADAEMCGFSVSSYFSESRRPVRSRKHYKSFGPLTLVSEVVGTLLLTVRDSPPLVQRDYYT